MITSDTIVQVCMEEEFFARSRNFRVSVIENMLEERDFFMLEDNFGSFVDFGGIPDLIQLACEALKWQRIRQDGVNITTALNMMVGA